MLNSMPFAPIGPAPEPDAPPRRYVAPDAGRFTWDAIVMGPGPCDRCLGAERCRSQHLACSAFELYVEGHVRWDCAPRKDATRARFQRIFWE